MLKSVPTSTCIVYYCYYYPYIKYTHIHVAHVRKWVSFPHSKRTIHPHYTHTIDEWYVLTFLRNTLKHDIHGKWKALRQVDRAGCTALWTIHNANRAYWSSAIQSTSFSKFSVLLLLFYASKARLTFVLVINSARERICFSSLTFLWRNAAM